MRKRVIIVGININNKNNFEESIIELKNLCIACDMEVVGKVEQNLKKINPTFYMGSGKIEELQDLIEKTNAEIIVFNNELSASQIKNIEEEVKGDYEWKLKVIIIEEKLILVYRKILLLVKILYINYSNFAGAEHP